MTDTNRLALGHFRDRVSHYLELHTSDYDNPDPDPDPVDWSTVIMQEAAVLHDRGPAGYLQYLDEMSERAAVSVDLDRELRLILGGKET